MTASSKCTLPPLAPPKGIPEAKPSWELDAESWIFPFWTSTSQIAQNKRVQAEVATLRNGSGHIAARQGLEQGAYHSREDVEHISHDVFHGGLGGWILYRYASSPIGPYDELIYVAGTFSSPSTSTKGLRITNIYVSTEASIWNGRRNWNIPKHLAEFQWSHKFRHSSNNSDSQTVRIFQPDVKEPFFSACLQPSHYIPRIPISTRRFFPALPLYQPAVRAGKYDVNQDASLSSQANASTASLPPDVLRATSPTFSGSFTLAYCSSLNADESYGDGIAFPKACNTLGYGVYLPKVTVDFPWSKEFFISSRSKDD